MDRDRRNAPRDEREERVNQFLVVDTGPVSAQANVCYEFQRSGRCGKGDGCRFSHGSSSAGPSGSGPGGERSAKDWGKLEAATVRRAADGSLELVDTSAAAAAAAAGAGAGAAGAKRQRETEEKESKKDKKRRKKEEKKRKKEEKKSKKDKKSKKKKEKKNKKKDGDDSDSSSSSSSSDGSPAKKVDPADLPPGAAGGHGPSEQPSPDVAVQRISEDDYFLKNHEFSMWLRSAHGRFFTELKADEARALFRGFVEEWNGRRLPTKLYAGVTVTGRR